MKRWTQEVIETRTITVTYTVEADTIEEARNKIAIGETVEETPHEFEMQVINRDPWGKIEQEGP